MSAAGFTPIQLFRTTTASAIPTAGSLADGELAINLTDERLYFKNAAGVVKLLASNTGSLGTVTSVAASGGTTGLTFSGSPITTSGTLTLGGTLAVANGGTGVTTSTGTGSVVLSNSPTLVTPVLGAATATSIANGLGAVGTPSYTFTGDTNTGMWSPAADTLAFSTAGSERVRVDSGGYLLINRTNRSSAVTSIRVETEGRYGSTVAGSAAYSFGTTGNAFTIADYSSGVSETERMRIDTSGNLLVGFTGSTNYRMLVSRGGTAGEIAQFTDGVAQSFTINSDASGLSVGNANNGYLAFNSNNTERMRITAAGDVGIGTTSPNGRLTIKQGAVQTDITTSSDNVSFENIDRGNLAAVVDTRFYTRNGKYQWFIGSYSEAMRLDASGNLGLGVTPSAWAGGISVFEFGSRGGLAASPVDVNLIYNTYFDGTNRYRVNDFASNFQQGGGQFRWFTAPSGTAGNAITFTQAMTLSAGQKLSIGTSATDIAVAYLVTQSAGDVDNIRMAEAGVTSIAPGIRATGDALVLKTSGTERARIDSSGNLLVGTTSAAGVQGATIYGDGRFFFDCDTTGSSIIKNNSTSAGASTMDLWRPITTGDPFFVYFGTEAAFTTRGSISFNRGGGVIAYNTTSDYRAKDIFGPVENPGATLDALKVYTGVMKGATIARPMLVAHEAQEVVPYAVTGEKDAVNEDGTEKYQQMDHQVLIPLLIAEIQSMRLRLAQLEGN